LRTCSLLWLCAAAAFAQDTQNATGTWTRFANLNDARYDACAVHLAPGQVLITGGSGADGALASAEILKSDGSVQTAASLNSARSRHTCTLLGDGRVLVTGGGPDSAEVYDPAADVWSPIPGNGTARTSATATTLLDGRVLIAGGAAGDTAVAVLEIFDPVSNLLLPAGAELQYPRTAHAAALLPDGRVAIIGGDAGAGPLRSVEIFDPAAQSVVSGPDLNIARSGHSATALEDGRILAAGGMTSAGETDSAETLDGAAEGWSILPAHLNAARTGHLALLVPGNGGVLLGGGSAAGQALAGTELFQPGDDTFQPLGSLLAPRSGLAGAALDDGIVLAMGGANSGGPQSGCGVLPLPALTFSAAVYHPSETARVSGTNFPANATIPLTLELVGGGSATAIPGRLLTSSAATGNGKLVAGFGPVPVVNVTGADAGQQFRVSVRLTSTISVVRTVPAKLFSAVTMRLPDSVLEGGSARFPIEVQRLTAPGPVTGSLTVSFGTATLALPVSGSATPFNASVTRTNLPPGPLSIGAIYSGDSISEQSSLRTTYTVASKTPIVELTSSTAAPQVGVPFTLSARVRLNADVPNGPAINGPVTILESGVPIGTATLVSSTTSPSPTVVANLPFTALSFAPLRLTASYAGNKVYNPATSITVTPVQQKAQTSLAVSLTSSGAVLSAQGPQFQCGAPTSFTGRLTFPQALGLSNRAFSVSTVSGDGSVRFIGASASGTLVPSNTQVGTAQGDAAFTLPFNAVGVAANFSGDTFLQPSTSAALHLSVQPIPMLVQFVGLPSTATNPVTLAVRVDNAAPPGCKINGPTGTVEIFDGTTSLGVVSLPPNTITPTQITDGTSNTIIFTESGKQVTLTVARPVGVHNLKAHYSGDAFHAATDSATVPVTFQ
jgi:hypothetical protein